MADPKARLADESADTAAIRLAIDRAAQAAQKIGTALYEQSHAEGAAPAGKGMPGFSGRIRRRRWRRGAGRPDRRTGNGQLNTEARQLRQQLEERTADVQRVKAEYDNYRKRVRRDRLAVREIAVANVLRVLLLALDGACTNEPLTPGLRDIADILQAQLVALGVISFGKVGDVVDPAVHDALTHHVSDGADRLVCSAVLKPGYRVGEHLLRPAHVEVTGPVHARENLYEPDRGAQPSTPAGKPALSLVDGTPAGG